MPTVRARLFVAVWPSPDVVNLLADTVERLRPVADPRLRWTRAEQWHATLVFLGEQDVEATAESFRRVALPPVPVTVTLGPETERFGRRIVHVPAAGLDAVATAVRAVLPGDDERPFRGHLTLARAEERRRRGGADRSDGEPGGDRGRSRGADLSSVVGVPLNASFLASEVTLVTSRLGAGPARYEVVDRLAL